LEFLKFLNDLGRGGAFFPLQKFKNAQQWAAYAQRLKRIRRALVAARASGV
jgi:hypothetical protein